MKKIFTLLMLLTMFTVTSVVHANEPVERGTEDDSEFNWGHFATSLLSHHIFDAIKHEYNLDNPTSGGFESNNDWVVISRGDRGDYLIQIKIKPHHVNHYDLVTFSVYPNRIYKEDGIKLTKYERDIK